MSSYSNNNNNHPNFDNLLLQSLMGRLQIRPPPNLPSIPFLPQTLLEELLFDIDNLSDNDENDYDDDNDVDVNKTQLSKEESKLEKEIIRTILSGKTETLKPNSGQAVTIGEHHICVGCHEETDSDYRVWEWHGHIMLFDEENGYTPEYIYGNYFERLRPSASPSPRPSPSPAKTAVSKEEDDDDDEKVNQKVGNLGLRELIESPDSGSSRILHRNINAVSPRASTYSFTEHYFI